MKTLRDAEMITRRYAMMRIYAMIRVVYAALYALHAARFSR